MIIPTPPCDPTNIPSGIVTYAEDFTAYANGPAFSANANWREVHDDIPFDAGDPNNTWPRLNLIHIIGNRLTNFRPDSAALSPPADDGSHCVGGIYLPAGKFSNWEITATWDSDARINATLAPYWVLAGPISQSNPSETNPLTNTLSYFLWQCHRSANSPITYEFRLGKVVAGVLTNIGTAFSTTSFGAGNTFTLQVLCNNSTQSGATIRGLVNGTVQKTSTPLSTGFVPIGRPGVGVFFNELLQAATAPTYTDSVTKLTNWSAKQLTSY